MKGLVAAQLHTILKEHKDMQAVGLTEDGQQDIALCVELSPQFVLVEPDMRDKKEKPDE
ncbi:hypothetical protein [Paenibacillus alvei]|uniref:Uncharacterized protein n=1 Tax=Paenibacillus alvei TaxID=44250 RepID=A0A383RC97_PAEAL|nr:hypothetical protein [Paenibacillus alvei]SYX84222.1 conserved protein of unknown function [Paenibacillus alvei]